MKKPYEIKYDYIYFNNCENCFQLYMSKDSFKDDRYFVDAFLGTYNKEKDDYDYTGIESICWDDSYDAQSLESSLSFYQKKYQELFKKAQSINEGDLFLETFLSSYKLKNKKE